MSDSDDTDVLLLIPPEIFIDSVERDLELNSFQSHVVGSLIEQVTDLESRLTLIESINSSCGNDSFVETKNNNSMVLNDCNTSGDVSVVNEELPNREDLISPSCALNTCEINSNTESSLDLNHRDNGMSKSKEALLKEIDAYLCNISSKGSGEEGGCQNTNNSNDTSLEKETIDKMTEDVSGRSPSMKRFDLPEVDRLLKEMENTQMQIENKLRMREIEYGLGGKKAFSNVSYRKSFPPVEGSSSSQERNSAPLTTYSPLKVQDFEKSKSRDDFIIKREAYLVGSSHNSDSDDTRKNGFGLTSVGRELKISSSFDSKKRFVSPRRRLFQSENSPLRKPGSGQSSSIHPSIASADINKKDYLSQFAAGDFPASRNEETHFSRANQPPMYNRNDLLSLANLWKSERDLSEDDSKKLRQKLEEEKFRRVHLENTIQDLQKRVLEEQEKLAVAVKVDEGKDRAITQITEAWKQMVNHWKEIEADRYAMSQAIIKEKAIIKQKEEDVGKKVERWEKEVSQALDLAAGYKSKYEMLESELSSTIDANNERAKDVEQKLKTLEEELQQLYEERKVLTDKLNLTQAEHEKEKQLVELVQKELSSLQELQKNTEAELTIVKEQRDLLSTRLREEKGRSSNLEQQKLSLQSSLDENKLKLSEMEEALKHSVENFEKAKVELRGMYQSQLEAVVKEKLDEFQSQLDKAQAAMKAELTEARRLAQERTAAQQQSLINSHAIEVRRLESMYKDEIRKLESKLAESERRREKLETGKKEIAHRLHGVMEAQWQQALSIITSEVSLRQGENDVSKRSIRDKMEEPIEHKIRMDPVELQSSFDETAYSKEIQTVSQRHSSKQDTLLKYIQMLLEKQPGKPIDSASSGVWPDVTPSDTLDDSVGEHKWNEIISNAASLQMKSDQDTLKPYPSSQRKPPWK